VLIQVISSTTREGRFSERTARWVVQSLRAREDFDVELIDLTWWAAALAAARAHQQR
jgi:NAD(P)H-dependent FMN reductase